RARGRSAAASNQRKLPSGSLRSRSKGVCMGKLRAKTRERDTQPSKKMPGEWLYYAPPKLNGRRKWHEHAAKFVCYKAEKRIRSKSKGGLHRAKPSRPRVCAFVLWLQREGRLASAVDAAAAAAFWGIL